MKSVILASIVLQSVAAEDCDSNPNLDKCCVAWKGAECNANGVCPGLSAPPGVQIPAAHCYPCYNYIKYFSQNINTMTGFSMEAVHDHAEAFCKDASGDGTPDGAEVFFNQIAGAFKERFKDGSCPAALIIAAGECQAVTAIINADNWDPLKGQSCAYADGKEGAIWQSSNAFVGGDMVGGEVDKQLDAIASMWTGPWNQTGTYGESDWVSGTTGCNGAPNEHDYFWPFCHAKWMTPTPDSPDTNVMTCKGFEATNTESCVDKSCTEATPGYCKLPGGWKKENLTKSNFTGCTGGSTSTSAPVTTAGSSGSLPATTSTTAAGGSGGGGGGGGGIVLTTSTTADGQATTTTTAGQATSTTSDCSSHNCPWNDSYCTSNCKASQVPKALGCACCCTCDGETCTQKATAFVVTV